MRNEAGHRKKTIDTNEYLLTTNCLMKHKVPLTLKAQSWVPRKGHHGTHHYEQMPPDIKIAGLIL